METLEEQEALYGGIYDEMSDFMHIEFATERKQAEGK